MLAEQRKTYTPACAPACHVRREAAEAGLVARVTPLAAQTRSSYGSRRRTQQFQDEGFAVGRYKARRVMQQAAAAAAPGDSGKG